VAAVADELLLSTFSARVLGGRVVVFVCKPEREIGDDDWRRYVEWLTSLQRAAADLGILVTPGGRAPSAAQRGLLSRELKGDRLKVAVMIADPAMLPIVRVASWFMKSVKPFGAHELEQALTYLGEPDVIRARIAIRELGGVVYKAAL
jgi:hypothetical protein